MKKAEILVTITVVVTALMIFDSHQAQASSSTTKIEVTDGGPGKWICLDGSSYGSYGGPSTEFHATADTTTTRRLSGTWSITVEEQSGIQTVAAGNINGGTVNRNSFTLLGTETSSHFADECGPYPVRVIITGQCGTDVGIALIGQNQHKVQAASFTDHSVSCTR